MMLGIRYTNGTKELLLDKTASLSVCYNCIQFLKPIVPGTNSRCNEFGHEITVNNEASAENCKLYWNKYINVENILNWIKK